jgi:dTDP-glucose pyrophosphorylase
MKISEINQHLIKESATIRDAMKKINQLLEAQSLVLFLVNDEKKIIGSITDGDIRRGLLNGFLLDNKADLVMNKRYHFLTKKSSAKEVKNLRDQNLKIVPVIDAKKKVLDFINLKKTKSMLPLDAVIMAGGRGTRLHPYTKNMPKPLLELAKKPIIVHNIDRLISFGIKNFYVSVNHMKEQIINFLDDYYSDSDISIKYLEETNQLGTIGSVALEKNYKNDDILVLNADILTNIDFEDFYITYKDSKNDMSVAAFSVKIDVPYAVLETNGDKVSSFIEKPSYVYHSNAGIYLFHKKFAKKIPSDQHYDAIDLMSDLIKNEKKVSHFPIRGYWLDIGNLQNYKKAQEDIGHIKFD